MGVHPLGRFPVQVSIAVAWGEMDAFAHLNNVAYFRYFETGRVAYFEKTDVMSASNPPQGVGPILASASCRYLAPVTYPDALTVGTCTSEIGDDRFTMEFAIYSEKLGRLVAKGDGLVVSYDYDSGTKAPLPSIWREGIWKVEGREF
jgi:acyl-CoA thioester hydrolase